MCAVCIINAKVCDYNVACSSESHVIVKQIYTPYLKFLQKYIIQIPRLYTQRIHCTAHKEPVKQIGRDKRGELQQ